MYIHIILLYIIVLLHTIIIYVCYYIIILWYYVLLYYCWALAATGRGIRGDAQRPIVIIIIIVIIVIIIIIIIVNYYVYYYCYDCHRYCVIVMIPGTAKLKESAAPDILNPNRSEDSFCLWETQSRKVRSEKTLELSPHSFRFVICGLDVVRKGRWYGWKPSSSSSFSIRAFRSQISQFELFELILLLNLDKQFPVEQFEASRAIRVSSILVSSTLPPS